MNSLYLFLFLIISHALPAASPYFQLKSAFETVDKEMEYKYDDVNSTINMHLILANFAKINVTKKYICENSNSGENWSLSDILKYKNYFEKKAFFFQKVKSNIYFNCLANQQEGFERDIKYRKEACGRFTDVNYSIGYKNSLVTIKLKLNLRYQGDTSKFNRVKQKLDKAFLCSRSFYAKLGINLNIEYGFDSTIESHHNVNIYDTYPYSPSVLNWPIINNVAYTEKEAPFGVVCSIISHEIGHMLGLNDSACKTAEESSPKSVMQRSMKRVAGQELSDGEIFKIIKPICK